jgi:hypothetical protein
VTLRIAQTCRIEKTFHPTNIPEKQDKLSGGLKTIKPSICTKKEQLISFFP